MARREKSLMRQLIEERGIKDVAGVQALVKELTAGLIQEAMDAELEEELGYSKYDYRNKQTDNSRNGSYKKTVSSSQGDIELTVPRDRNGEYEPQIVKKHQMDISAIEDKIIFLYSQGTSTRDIEKTMQELYGIEVDATHGTDLDGKKDVLGLWVGATESSKYWLGVLNGLKNRGVQDILMISVDGLTGFSEAIAVAYPQTDVQRCIVHQIRSSTRYVSYKDVRAFTAALKPIYKAPTEESALEALGELERIWGTNYPASIRSWRDHWDELSTMFKYPEQIRRMIYTTNAIENFNRQLRKVTKAKSAFVSDDALLKQLYLVTMNITDKWTMPIKDWGSILMHLMIYFGDRVNVRL